MMHMDSMSMGPPPTDELNQHMLIDVVMAGAHRTVESVDPDGNITYTSVPDDEVMFWRTQLVANPNLGQFVLELKELDRLGQSADQHMPKERAEIVKAGVSKIIRSYLVSIAAKSAESRLDDHNSRQTLLDKLSHTKSEQIITQRGGEQARGRIADMMFNRGDPE